MKHQIWTVAWHHHASSWASWRNILLTAGIVFGFFILLQSSVTRYAFLFLFSFDTMAKAAFNVFYVGLLVGIPVLALLLTYDCIAGNVERKLSHLFFARVNRGVYACGVLLSVFLYFIELFVVLMLLMFLSTSSLLQHVAIEKILSVFVFLFIYAISWVSLSYLCSVVARNSSRALFLSIGLYLFFLFLGLKGESVPPIDFVPSLESFSLFPEAGVLLLFSVLILLGTWWRFEVMDL